MPDIDFGAVAKLVRDVAQRELLPRFANLRDLVVHAKPSAEDPSDIVTEADEAVERILTGELLALAPGSIVIGEEATARDGTVRDALDAAPLAWLVDPLDGTKNFAAGRDTFGTMVTLCRRGDAIASWIHRPTTGVTCVAELGGGAWIDGTRVVASEPTAAMPAGTLHVAFMPPDVRAQVEAAAAGAAIRSVPSSMSAAVEYPDLATGCKDFNLYWRILPWDHAPGALLLTEAGGSVRRADGSPYRAADRGTLALAVRQASLWDGLRRALLP